MPNIKMRNKKFLFPRGILLWKRTMIERAKKRKAGDMRPAPADDRMYAWDARKIAARKAYISLIYLRDNTYTVSGVRIPIRVNNPLKSCS